MPLPPELIARCAAARDAQGYVGLDVLLAGGGPETTASNLLDHARSAAQVFNGSFETRQHIQACARRGDHAAANLAAWMDLEDLPLAPVQKLSPQHADDLEAALHADPTGYITAAQHPYPYAVNEKRYGFDPQWVATRLAASRGRLADFQASRQSDTAVLVGNGPSLNDTNLDLLSGMDTYISNYAVKHPKLRRHARGVSVSNYFVAAQEPEAFSDLPFWRVFPVGLSDVVPDTPKTIWLNAQGGPLFFSTTPLSHIAWHATVTYFWLQLLLAVGYRKVLLIGVDNTYRQPDTAREGDILHQTEDDPNHFDAHYFKGKVWQAADTDHMHRTYMLAKQAYELADAVIINCTVGGALDVFPRSTLEIEHPRTP